MDEKIDDGLLNRSSFVWFKTWTEDAERTTVLNGPSVRTLGVAAGLGP